MVIVTGKMSFDPIDEFVKYPPQNGVLWQVLRKGEEFSVESSNVYCTSCYEKLPRSYKCRGCNKQHKILDDIGAAANAAAESYKAQKRREKYKVVVPQVGEKITEADIQLPDSRYMNTRLENRKGVEQVVITVGDKSKSQKAQIIVDLAKNEIRHDQTNDDPRSLITAVELHAGDQRAKKEFSATKVKRKSLAHPYLYANGSSYTNWADGASLSLNIMSDESEEYFLEEVKLEGFSSKPNRSLTPKSITNGITINGPILPFTAQNPRLKIVVSRGADRYLVEQEIKTSARADGKYNLEQWVERPSLIKSID